MRLNHILPIVIQAVALLISVTAQDDYGNRHILYLNSYDSRMSWVKDIEQAIEEVLEPDFRNLILYIENMDSKVFHTDEYYEAYGHYFRTKYRDLDLSLILCSDNNAFDFVKKYGSELFSGTPVVFCGVNDFNQTMIQDLPNFTGVAEIFSVEDTLDFALKMHPRTEEIFIINDYLSTGRSWQQDIEKRLKYLERQVDIRYSENMSMEELLKTISSLQERTIILLGVYFSDRDGRFSTYEKTGRMISEASNVPLYCLLEFNIGYGAIGGKVINGYSQGYAMAQLADRVLDGESPSAIPIVQEEANRFIFDYISLKKYGISLENLPPDSLILNRPYSVFDEYRNEILTVIALISILIVTVIFLIFNVLRKKQAEQSLKQLAEASWEGIIIHCNGVALQFNDMFLKIFGYERREIEGQPVLEKIFASEFLDEVSERIKSNNSDPYEAIGVRKGGETFPIEIRLRIMEYRGQSARVAAIRDLTDQKKMEERFRQSQKMQAIGTLAGGIAHDFNNILSAVIGYADLGLLAEKSDSRCGGYFEQILKAGKRARDLVKQILTFSRQSNQEKQFINFGVIIKETIEMLKASMPSTIQIQKEIDSSLCVLANPVQLQQIVMNLGTNAKLAMEEHGGILEVELKEAVLDGNPVSPGVDLPPGRYAQLIVRDNGCGMDDETLQRVFEPFFTTREQGKGTGMGLSVVHGLVSEMKGNIHVYSTVGTGTTFNILLPACSGEQIGMEEAGCGNVMGGSERILFVDDEIFQVNLARELLGILGYSVTATTSSREALEIIRKNPEGYDLVISDVTMPEMTGDILVGKIRGIRKDLPILISSGYSERITAKKLEELGVQEFVMKPLLLKELAEKIRSALGE